MELNTDLTGKVAVVTGASGTLLPTQGGLEFEFLILHHKNPQTFVWGFFVWWWYRTRTISPRIQAENEQRQGIIVVMVSCLLF